MGNLQKNFSCAFDGKVWNIESEINGKYLIIEVRNEETFTTSFFVYDSQNNQLIGEAIGLDETWWTGVTYAVNDVIVFHTFQDTDNPLDKKFLAMDKNSRKILWEKSDLTFKQFGKEFLLGTRGDDLLYINIKTGQEEKDKNGIGTLENKWLQFPFHYVPNSEHHKTVYDFLGLIGMDSDKNYGIDYLEKDGIVIISYYTKKEYLENRLIVINTDRKVLLEEVLGSQLKGIADRPFFVNHDSLIFVKNSTDFLSYQLSRK